MQLFHEGCFVPAEYLRWSLCFNTQFILELSLTSILHSWKHTTHRNVWIRRMQELEFCVLKCPSLPKFGFFFFYLCTLLEFPFSIFLSYFHFPSGQLQRAELGWASITCRQPKLGTVGICCFCKQTATARKTNGLRFLAQNTINILAHGPRAAIPLL